MSPRTRVRIGAMLAFAIAAMGVVAPATAQLYEEARQSLGLSPDPLARSPRLIGMGRLIYVLDDSRNRISLWDYAGNPTGVLEEDSTSTLELVPSTSASSSVHNLEETPAWRERQELASREVRFGYEAWHRTGRSSAYGLVGDIGVLRADQPFNQDIERRSNFTLPQTMGIVNGHVPYLFTERMEYALRVVYGYQSSNDRYRRIIRNAAGDYLDLGGDIVPNPQFFTPDRYSVRTLGGGGALSFRLGKPLTIAGGFDDVGSLLKGTNEGGRYDSETRENRPYATWQFSGVGSLANRVEYGVDYQTWNVISKSTFVFTMSTGSATPPLAGRGNLYERDEKGSLIRSRVRSKFGPFDLGGGVSWSHRKTDIKAPGPTDSTSFNVFRNGIYYIPSADTLYLPDSVANDHVEERAWDAGGGLGWTRSDGRLMAGAEFHRMESRLEGDILGDGPKRTSWDVRTGLEVALGRAVRARTGYIHRWDDRDARILENEYLANALTLGLGLKPAGVTWTIETGFVYEWERPDFGDPGQSRSTRQQLALRIFWPL